jgi:hypothetical protein
MAVTKAVEVLTAPVRSSIKIVKIPTPVIVTLRMSGIKNRGAVDHAPHPSKLRA